MPLPAFVEGSLGWLLSSQKGRDAKLITKSPAFAASPNSTITVESPECGPSGSKMAVEHTQLGEERFPELKWSGAPKETHSFLLLCEDPDAPLPDPIIHGLYYSIPPTVTQVAPSDFKPEDGGKFSLKGGFKYGESRGGKIYLGPRPVLNHGPHRYFFSVVALKEELNFGGGSTLVKKEEVLKALNGKVLAWGTWIGTFERKW